MYLFQNEDERDTHLACLIAVAQADGNISETERQYISYICTLYGRDLASVEKQAEENLQSLLSALREDRQKMILLQDLIALSYVDGKYVLQERRLVRHAADLLHLERSKVDRLEELNERIVAVNSEIAKLIGLSAEQ